MVDRGMGNKDLLEFGKRLRSIRSERGLSQEELGSMAGLDRTYISGIERGVRNVGLINIFRIAAALEISVQDLFRSSAK
jgi:transcriptional regulator with XRE-family HTH domain